MIREALGINDWLELIKEDKNLNGAYICISQYLYLVEKENQELKKKLEEKQNPFKGIFAQVNDDTLLRDCGNMNAEMNELKNQQKEFIKYLENRLDICDGFLDTIKSDLQEIPYGVISANENITTRIKENETAHKVYEEILQKYKSIIGVSDEKEN